MNKYLKIVLIVLLVVLGGVGGYFIYSQYSQQSKKVNDLTVENKDKDDEIKKLNEENNLFKTSIDSLRAEVELYQAKEKANEEEKKSPYFGWKTYTDTGLGIKFQYPSTFTVTREGDGLGIYTAISDQLGNNTYEMRKSVIVNIGTTNPFAYAEDKMNFENDDPRSVEVDGKKYEFTKFGMAEGFGMYSGGYSTFATKLKPEIYATITKSFLLTKKYDCSTITYPYEAYEVFNTQEDCVDFNYTVIETNFMTSNEDIEKALLLLSSIKYL